MSLTIEKEEGPSSIRLILSGNLGTETHQDLEKELLPLCETEGRKIILDLGNLKYVTSMGLRVIFAAARQSQRHHGQLLLAKLQPQIRKVFDIVGALPDLKIFRNDEELDRYLMTIQRKELGS